ncbi:hypothetical protein [Arthrobacter sp.]|uniref:hypothetical protein n=1 Tax=Arthrobacter sp. TaxID=1667 RepID=UPI003A959230
MKRLADYTLYADGDPQWLLSNVWDESEGCFFLEVFSRSDEDQQWERSGAYYIDDRTTEQAWFAKFRGVRQEFTSEKYTLPAPRQPSEHIRDGDMAVHRRAARSTRH